VICNQLQTLQQHFATLLMAAEHQEELAQLGVVPVENKEAIKLFREELERRLAALGSELSEHVHQHGCAN
jgi:hypothetical protein